MKRLFIGIQALSWIAIVSSLVGTLLMFYIGAVKTFFAVRQGIFGYPGEGGSLEALESGDAATVYVIKALDAFLIGFVLFLFAYGVYRLFVCNQTEKKDLLFTWIQFPGFGHLKLILTEVILVILFVKFLEIVLTRVETLNWEMLVLPISILLLGITLKLVDLAGGEKAHAEELEKTTQD